MISKKITIIILSVTLAVALVACSGSKSDESAYQSPEQANPSSSVNDPVYTGSVIEDSPFIGSFVNTYCMLYASNAVDFYVDYEEQPADGTPVSQPLEVSPQLVCTADGNFTFTFNTDLDGCYAVATGTFKVDGDNAEFTVTNIEEYGDVEGYDGENLASFAMSLVSTDEMRYSGDQAGYITTGDVFKREAN